MKISLRLAHFIVLFYMLCSSASAAVWSGWGTDDKASDPANWREGVLPSFADNIMFDATSAKNCTWDLVIVLLSLSMEGGYPGSLTVTSPLILSNGFADEWSLFITDNGGAEQGPFILTFAQAGNNVYVAPSSDGDFTVTFSGPDITMTNLGSGGITTTYIGMISPDGTAMSGIESTSDGLHSGTWHAIRTVDCTDYTYSDWGSCTSGSQSRTVTGYTPTSCSGTPSTSAVLTQACTPTNLGGPIVLQQNSEYALTLAAKQTQAFQFTTPTGGCGSALHKWIRITMINVNLTGGDGQLLVKSSNHGASTALPTLADYTYIFGQYNYSSGQDWTRDPNGGVFFWNWSLGAANEILAVLPTYTGHTFNQDDTYYMLLYNQGTNSNSYRVLWQCY